MKKYLLFSLCVLLFQACQNDLEDLGELSNNEPEVISYKVTVEEAKETAMDFIKSIKDNPGTRSSSILAKDIEIADVDVVRFSNLSTRSMSDDFLEIDIDTLIYAVNFADNNGFALVGADRRTDPIFAIIDEGNFNLDEIPEESGFLLFLENAIGKTIADIQENKEVIETRALKDWTVKSIVPAILKVKWGQNDPYNKYCPGPKTGCTVVATSQILSHYKTIGRVTWSHNGSGGTANLNWNRIISDSESNSGELSSTKHPQSANEVAHLMRYLGMAFGADYKKNSTSVGEKKAIEWMNDWGGLNASKLKDYNEANIINAIKSGKLVYGRGNSGKKKFLGIRVKYTGGHAWVYDGHISATKAGKTYNLLHCNWGWHGQDNGYYLSKVFNTNVGPEITDREEKQITRSGEKNNYKYNLEYSIVTR